MKKHTDKKERHKYWWQPCCYQFQWWSSLSPVELCEPQIVIRAHSKRKEYKEQLKNNSIQEVQWIDRALTNYKSVYWLYRLQIVTTPNNGRWLSISMGENECNTVNIYHLENISERSFSVLFFFS